MLNVIDEYSRQCLAIRVRRRFTAGHVVEVLSELMILHGTPEHIRSDQGPEFVAKAVQDWIPGRGEDGLHREGEPLGERLLRELQLQAPGRAAGSRDLLQPARSGDPD